jgi:hypothetical protein
MTVKRIVANIAADQIGSARAFYGDILGMTVVMDMGWIVTFAADQSVPPQIGTATEGGSGTPVPDLSIEVDDLLHSIHKYSLRKLHGGDSASRRTRRSGRRKNRPYLEGARSTGPRLLIGPDG